MDGSGAGGVKDAQEDAINFLRSAAGAYGVSLSVQAAAIMYGVAAVVSPVSSGTPGHS